VRSTHVVIAVKQDLAQSQETPQVRSGARKKTFLRCSRPGERPGHALAGEGPPPDIAEGAQCPYDDGEDGDVGAGEHRVEVKLFETHHDGG